MQERERDEILWRLDERTKRVDDHLARLDERVEQIEADVEDHGEQIQTNESNIEIIMKAGGGAVGFLTTTVSAALAHLAGFIKL